MAEDDLEQLALRAGSGDEAAFGRLVEATTPRLHRIILRYLGRPAEVEDVLQETYLRAYGALSSGAFERRARVDSWLTRIALNAAVDVLRRNRRRRIIGIGDVNDDFALGEAAPADAVVALRQLAEALDRLPEAQRAAFVLTQVEGMSAPEAGDALGCTTGAVEQRVGRARAALRRWLA